MEIIKGSAFNEKVLKSDKPVIVDFFATWCGPCKALAPILSELAETLKGKIDVYKLDIDEPENMKLIEAYDVQAVPTMLFVKNGKVVTKMIGLESREAIAKAVMTLMDQA